MKKAIGYARISDEDQSTWSIPGQRDLITDYCIKNDIELVAIFTDEGYTAANFDRADWKQLEEFVTKNYKDVDMLLVMAWTRFSRNTKEALAMIDDLEQRYHIRVISIREPLHLHPDSPFYSHMRTQMIQYGELELRMIKDRTKFGIYNAQKNGRYISKAPRGYLNSKNENGEPVIIVDPAKKDIIIETYTRFLAGETIDSIRKAIKSKGTDIKGNSSVQDILKNPVYMGYIKQIAYYDDPEKLVKAIHEPIISETTWWKVQAIFNIKKSLNRSVISDNFPFRGVLKCFCSRNLTGAFSKGRKVLVPYYKCNSHTRINLNANKLHAQFDQLLSHLNLPAFHIQYLQEKVILNLNDRLRNREKELQEKQQQLSALEKKIDSMEEKYLSNDFDKPAYMKWKTRYHGEKSLLQSQLGDLRKPLNQVWENYHKSLHQLADLQYIYNGASVQQKQAFVRTVFNNQLYYQEGVYRTPTIMRVFEAKAPLLSEKRLLIIDQPLENTANLQKVPPTGAELNPLFSLLQLFNDIRSKAS